MNLLKEFIAKNKDESVYVKDMNGFLKEAIRTNVIDKNKLRRNGVSSDLLSSWLRKQVAIPINILAMPEINDAVISYDSLTFSCRGGNGNRSCRIPQRLSRNLAYFLGFLAGDGCLLRKNYAVSLCFSDNEIVSLVTKILCEEFSLNPKVKNYGNWDVARIDNKPFYLFIRSVFEFPAGKKKGRLSVPGIIKTAPLEIKLNFLRGFFAADGCLCRTEKTYSLMFKQSTKQFLLEVQDIIFELGFTIRGPYFDKQNKSWLLGTWKKDNINGLASILA